MKASTQATPSPSAKFSLSLAVANWKSHCEVVLAANMGGDHTLYLIGGNVMNTVAMRKLSLDRSGRIQLPPAGLARLGRLRGEAEAERRLDVLDGGRQSTELARARQHDNLGAYLALNEEATLAQARAADARLDAGERTPLLGVPLAHKDIFVTRDWPTTAGSNGKGSTSAMVERIAREAALKSEAFASRLDHCRADAAGTRAAHGRAGRYRGPRPRHGLQPQRRAQSRSGVSRPAHDRELRAPLFPVQSRRRGAATAAMSAALVATAALLVDAGIGETPRLHPLVGFGRWARAIEGAMHADRRISGLLAWGLAVLPLVSVVAWAAHALQLRSPGWAMALSTLLLYLAVGHRSLWEHAHPIATALA